MASENKQHKYQYKDKHPKNNADLMITHIYTHIYTHRHNVTIRTTSMATTRMYMASYQFLCKIFRNLNNNKKLKNYFTNSHTQTKFKCILIAKTFCDFANTTIFFLFFFFVFFSPLSSSCFYFIVKSYIFLTFQFL